jgi:ABC-type amino acid transport substrate-binding protein
LLYTVAYAFPHAGKMLSKLFVPFVAWFFGDRIDMTEYPQFLFSGLAAYFAGPLVAIPFLLDQMHLPHDMFQLFLLTGIVGERLGDALGVMHLAALALVTLAVLQGSRRQIVFSSLQFAFTFAITGLLAVVLAQVLLNRIPVMAASKAELIAQLQLIERPVQATVVLNGQPNPERLQQGESVIERIRRRGVMRVGFNEDKLPFVFFNARRELVGLDVDLAHALARDLGVTIEFVRFDRSTLVQQLQADHFDVVMSGLVGTLERSEAMQHTHSYMDATLGLVVPDFRVRDFKSLNSIRQIDGLRIGFVDLSRGFISRLNEVLPDAELVELRSNRDYFENSDSSLDALLVSAETGSAFTLLYPAHEIVIPAELDVKIPLFYAITGRDEGETRTFLNHWIELRQKDGTFRNYYEHWILGKPRHPQKPRWSVLQDVLGWGR